MTGVEEAPSVFGVRPSRCAEPLVSVQEETRTYSVRVYSVRGDLESTEGEGWANPISRMGPYAVQRSVMVRVTWGVALVSVPYWRKDMCAEGACGKKVLLLNMVDLFFCSVESLVDSVKPIKLMVVGSLGA